MQEEIWKPVKYPGYEHYHISNKGRFKNTKSHPRWGKDKITEGSIYPYYATRSKRILLCGDNKKRIYRCVPIIVAEHFLKLPKDFTAKGKYIVDHLDGDLSNCAADNLVIKGRKDYWDENNFGEKNFLKNNGKDMEHIITAYINQREYDPKFITKMAKELSISKEKAFHILKRYREGLPEKTPVGFLVKVTHNNISDKMFHKLTIGDVIEIKKKLILNKHERGLFSKLANKYGVSREYIRLIHAGRSCSHVEVSPINNTEDYDDTKESIKYLNNEELILGVDYFVEKVEEGNK